MASNAGNNQRLDFRELTAAQFEDFWRVGCFSGFLVGRRRARRLCRWAAAITIIFTGASASIRDEAGLRAFLRRQGQAFYDLRRAWRANTGRLAFTSRT